MSKKGTVMLGMVVGSTIGGYLPILFGVSAFSFTSLITGFIGGILGIWIGVKIIR